MMMLKMMNPFGSVTGKDKSGGGVCMRSCNNGEKRANWLSMCELRACITKREGENIV